MIKFSGFPGIGFSKNNLIFDIFNIFKISNILN